MFKQSHNNTYLRLKKATTLFKQISNCDLHQPVQLMHQRCTDSQPLRQTQHPAIYRKMFQHVRCSSINKLQVQSDIHASLKASDEFVVLNDRMSGKHGGCLALHRIHPARKRGGEAEAHAPLGVRLRASHLILNVKVPEHLLLLLKGLHALVV